MCDNTITKPLVFNADGHPSNEAEQQYLAGLDYAQRSEWGRAATCFRKSVALAPDSPAQHSLEMIESILSYYHKDNFNP